MLLAVLFCSVFLTSNVFAQGGQLKKVGFLDLSKIFDNYEKTKEYDSVLENKHNVYKESRDEKIEKLQEAQSKLALLKEEEKDKVQKDLEKMRTDLLEYDQDQRVDLTKQRDEKIREILLEIEKVVSDYAKSQGFDIILNDRVLIYGSEGFDVTDQILKILNDNYNKK